MDFTAARKAMVDSQVRVNDVTDRDLQTAMLGVERETFCAPERAYAAYVDGSVEIAGDRRLMPARDLGKLLQAAEAKEGERVLAIAAPYAAAVLADMGLKATAQEADQAVFDVVGEALAKAGVETALAPLDQPVGDNWDLIVCEGGVPAIPAAWGAALRPGGRMVLVERTGAVGKAALFLKGREGLSRRELFDSAPAILAALAPVPTFAL